MKEIEETDNDTELIKDSSQYLTFYLGGDLFGVVVSTVMEVIQSVKITPVPLVSEAICGVINVRGIVIPVIDLQARLFNRKSSSETEDNNSVIIFEIDDRDEKIPVGARVDSVVSVIDFLPDDIKPGPDFGLKFPAEFIDSIGNIDNSFIVMLDISQVLNVDDISMMVEIQMDMKDILSAKALGEEETHEDNNVTDKEENGVSDNENFVIFAIDGEYYGLPMDRVQEIIKTDEISPVPNSMPFMKGIINLRGRVVPLVDMRLKCGLEEREYNKDTSIIIAEHKNFLIGLIVDIVNDITGIPLHTIQETLHYSAKIDEDFIHSIARLDEKFIIVLDTDKILSEEEIEKIESENILTPGEEQTDD